MTIANSLKQTKGHAGAILQAKQLGRYLVVGVHSDEEIFDNKGSSPRAGSRSSYFPSAKDASIRSHCHDPEGEVLISTSCPPLSPS